MGHINGFSSSSLDSLGSFSFVFSSATGVDCLEGREYCEDAKLSERGEEKEEVEVVVDGDESVREREGACVDDVDGGASVEILSPGLLLLRLEEGSGVSSSLDMFAVVIS